MAMNSVATQAGNASAPQRNLDVEDQANEALYQAKGIVAMVMAATDQADSYSGEEVNGALWAVHRLIEQAKSLLDTRTSAAGPSSAANA